jgi:hypothetical protein
MNHCSIKHVGLDDHKDSIHVAVADEAGGEVRDYGAIAHTPQAVSQLLGRLSLGGHLLVCWHEAGPGGPGINDRLLRSLFGLLSLRWV